MISIVCGGKPTANAPPPYVVTLFEEHVVRTLNGCIAKFWTNVDRSTRTDTLVDLQQPVFAGAGNPTKTPPPPGAWDKERKTREERGERRERGGRKGLGESEREIVTTLTS